LQHLQGTITPNSLHFERHHAGIPDIDASRHNLVINGLVRQPLAFSYDDLLKYPMVSKIHFLECSGNSGALTSATPADGTVQSLHGLVSCAEWTGIPLSILLDEAGVLPGARWISAVGADAASMGRSVPINKALDDVLLALYQNGEPVRPEQGFPMRLLVPGWEGNLNVKWLTQIKLTPGPSNFRDETSKYTDTLADRTSLQFTYPMGCKSLITSPSGQMALDRQGLYQITGIAWSGAGSIRHVEVSADGGQTWADALIESHQSDRALTRFRIPWQWQGGNAVLQSRATDDRGNVQPTRSALLAERGVINRYHYHGIQSWSVVDSGEVSNVYV
jgi:sulfane dehydrogenase subunit SoxC